MADKLVIQIDGDASGLIKQLTSAETRLNTFNSRVTNASRNLTNMMKNLGGFGSSIKSIADACNTVASSLNAASAKMDSFTNSINNVSRASRASASDVSSLGDSIKGMILTLYSIRAVIFTGKELFGGVVDQVIDTNAQFERMNILLQNVSHGGTQAQKELLAKNDMNYIWDLANKAPFSVEAISNAFVRFKANGLDPANGTLKGLLNAVASFGGDEQNIQHAILGISEMLEMGTVQTRQLRMLATTGGIPTAIHDLADAMGKTVPELKDAMKKGAVDAGPAVAALMAKWNVEYAGGAERMMNTWTGLTQRMENAWKQTILRITSDDGQGSLFKTVEDQASQFVQFLNSADGDNFLKGLDQDFASLTTAIVGTVKVLYQYKDLIIGIGKEVAFITGAKLAWQAFTGLAGVIVGIGVQGVAFLRWLTSVVPLLRDMAAAENAAAIMGALLSERAVEAATSIGLLNAAGELSLVWLGVFAAVVVAVGGAAYLLYKYLNNTTTAVKGMGVAHDTATTAIQKMNQALKDNPDNAAEKGARALADARIAEAKATYTAAQAEISRQKALAQKNYDDAGKGFQMVTRHVDATRGHAAYDVEERQELNTESPGNSRSGPRPSEQAVVRDKAKQAFMTAYQAGKTIDAAYNDVVKKANDIAAAQQQAKIAVDTDDGDGKPAKDKLGSVDARRMQYVNQEMEIAKIYAEIQDKKNGNTEASDLFAANSGDMEAALKTQAEGVKSQSQLNDMVKQGKTDLSFYRQALKEVNTATVEKNRSDERMKDLNSQVAQETLQANDALGKLNDGYNSVDAQVARYVEQKQNEFKTELNSKDANVRTAAAMDIANLAYEKRIQLLSEEAAKSKTNIDEYNKSIMTRSQAADYELNTTKERLQGLIAEQEKAWGPGSADLVKEFYAELDTANKKAELEKNPFAKWALEAQDYKAKAGDAITSSFDSFITDLANGKASFKDFAKSLITDLGQIIIKAILAKAILSALGIGGYTFGSTGFSGETPSIVSSNFGIPSLNTGTIDVGTPVFHSGGTVGSAGGTSRKVDSALFAFAKRYHTGGFPGLADGEVPIIAKKGEGVFTEEQMKAMANGKSGTAEAPQINVINQTGGQVKQDQSSMRFDGKKWVTDIILQGATTPGPMRDLLKGVTK